jgi:hypothetical protein
MARRRKRKSSGAMKKAQNRMTACAREWKRKGKPGKLSNFNKKCLKGR